MPKSHMFDARSEYQSLVYRSAMEADIVNLQFPWGLIDYPSFFQYVARDKPLVITMHDLSSFTGGCGYTNHCFNFLQSCGNCPMLGRPLANDITYQQWKIKQQAYRARPPHFVAVSHWLAGMAKKSSLLKNEKISVIYNGLDLKIFKPQPKDAARAFLHVPQGEPVLAFAAASLSDRRKGVAILIDALRLMKQKPFLLTWGKKPPQELSGFRSLYLGNIENESIMVIAYSAADALAVPSLEENLPQTVTESMACGTPVVAFASGGIPEVVQDGETGLLAEVGNLVALTEALNRMFGNPNLQKKYSLNSIKKAQTSFSFEKNAESYISLYDNILSKKK